MTNVTSPNGNRAGKSQLDNRGERKVFAPLHTIIGAQVLRSRRGLGLTSTQLAAKVGISVSYLSKIEHGKIAPSLSTLQLLARSLYKPIASFLVETKMSSTHHFDDFTIRWHRSPLSNALPLGATSIKRGERQIRLRTM